MANSQYQVWASEYAPYDVYQTRLPDEIAPIYQSLTMTLAHNAQTVRPKNIFELILVPERSWLVKSPSLQLFAFGTFRSAGATILRLAELVAPAYLENPILPVIRPITSGEWWSIVSEEAREFRAIRRAGLLAYSRNFT